jgi:hypothetical protein
MTILCDILRHPLVGAGRRDRVDSGSREGTTEVDATLDPDG